MGNYESTEDHSGIAGVSGVCFRSSLYGRDQVMTAQEIRGLKTVAGRNWDDLGGVGYQLYELTEMIKEVAAQLAELNETITKKNFSPTVYASMGEAGLP